MIDPMVVKMADAHTEFYASITDYDGWLAHEDFDTPYRQFSDWVDQMIRMEDSGVLDD
jgi:hypothetical protein